MFPQSGMHNSFLSQYTLIRNFQGHDRFWNASSLSIIVVQGSLDAVQYWTSTSKRARRGMIPFSARVYHQAQGIVLVWARHILYIVSPASGHQQRVTTKPKEVTSIFRL